MPMLSQLKPCPPIGTSYFYFMLTALSIIFRKIQKPVNRYMCVFFDGNVILARLCKRNDNAEKATRNRVSCAGPGSGFTIST
jgi:hypothetical protein